MRFFTCIIEAGKLCKTIRKCEDSGNRGLKMPGFYNLLIFSLFGLIVFGIIGWGLVEVTIEFFTNPPPGLGVVYRTTSVSDAIVRAIKEDYDSNSVRTRPKPENQADRQSNSVAD